VILPPYEILPELYPCGPYVPTERGGFLTPSTGDILFLSGTDLVLSSEDGLISYADISGFLNVPTSDYELVVNSDILTLSGNNGDISNVDLNPYLDGIQYELELDSPLLILSGSDGSSNSVNLTVLGGGPNIKKTSI